MPNKVELWNAWGWTCDDCGRDNLERGVTAELTDEELRELRDELGVDDNEHVGAELVSQPTEVICTHCGATFEVELPEGPGQGG